MDSVLTEKEQKWKITFSTGLKGLGLRYPEILNTRGRAQLKQAGRREFGGRGSTFHEDSRDHIRSRPIRVTLTALG